MASLSALTGGDEGHDGVSKAVLPITRQGRNGSTRSALPALRALRGKRRRMLFVQIAMFVGALALLHVGFNWRSYTPAAVGDFIGGAAEQQQGEAAMTTLEGGATGRKLLDDFPRDVLLNAPDGQSYSESTNKYWLVLHLIGVIYMFTGLAIVCDDYFVPALEEMSERWNISEDVAGATFMAAGGSAPELFTSILGVFVAQSNVGFGTIVGSAVFNVLFVIGLCAIFAKEVLALTWWPLARDCTYYAFGLIVLVLCVLDQNIYWYESLILLGLYFGYTLIMKFNPKLRAKAESFGKGNKTSPSPNNPTDLEAIKQPMPQSPALRGTTSFVHHKAMCSSNEAVRFRDFRSGTLRAMLHGHLKRLTGWLWKAGGGTKLERQRSHSFRIASMRSVTQVNTPTAAKNPPTAGPTIKEGDENASEGTDSSSRQLAAVPSEHGIPVLPVADQQGAPSAATAAAGSSNGAGWATNGSDASSADVSKEAETGTSPGRKAWDKQASGAPEGAADVDVAAAGQVAAIEPDEDLDADEGLFDVPESKAGKVFWALALPLNLLMFLTIPDCKKEKLAKFFIVSFIMSLVWIAAFSYCMVWWASVLGFALGIPDAVMGLTILAGGTSIPDAISSVIVARNGFGDMAVSSSIGSNIFDINVGLPLPWLIKNLITGEPVGIGSCGLFILTASLLVMVLFVVMSIKCMGWKLDMRLGGVMFVLYLLFVAESLVLEYVVFAGSSC